MRIAIGTLNKAKLLGATRVLSQIYQDAQFVPVEVESEIRGQPLSDAETIKGAIRRAQNSIKKVSDADIGVGLEGGVQKINGLLFIVGWVAIADKDGNMGIGSGGRVLLPSDASNDILNGQELGDVMSRIIGKETRHDIGAVGALTKQLYTRDALFSDSTKCALAQFLSAEHYGDLPKKIASSYL